MVDPVRVVIGEDDVLLREGIVRLLAEAGIDVVAQAGDAQDLLRKGLAHRPSVLIADVNMPPGKGDDGLRAAMLGRRQRDSPLDRLSRRERDVLAVMAEGSPTEVTLKSSWSARPQSRSTLRASSGSSSSTRRRPSIGESSRC